MKKVVMIRHGESVWNKENKFTGWTDVDLSPTGIQEAQDAAKVLLENNIRFETAYTSYLKRAIKTMNVILEGMDLLSIPVEKSWRLNEKHYGVLQGLNKAEMAQKYGEEQVKIWRRSYDVAPDPIPENDPRNTRLEEKYKGINPQDIPLTESLKDCTARTLPYWENTIKKSLEKYDCITIVAHGNSLRSIVKSIKNISDQDIVSLNIPTAMPYVFEFNDQLEFQQDYFLGDPEEIQRRMDAVANQGKTK